jgi:DNA-binding response OmpR family regulator
VEAVEADFAGHTGAVLVVDDERGPRLALQLILQRQFQVVTAETGEAALDLLRAQPVDAVTLDLKMPGLGGANTLAMIRDIDPDLPVIIITGYGSYESAVKALKLRAFDYISKPFDSKKILQVVTGAVEERRLSKVGGCGELADPLDAVLEAAGWLEEHGAPWLTEAGHDALERIRNGVRSVRRRVRPKAVRSDKTEERPPQKEHG